MLIPCSYGPYASSALAAQSLARKSSSRIEMEVGDNRRVYLPGNIFATAFPLFTSQMYNTLGYKWANFLFAFIAIALIPVPYVRQFLIT
jgi:hypothetical protein